MNKMNMHTLYLMLLTLTLLTMVEKDLQRDNNQSQLEYACLFKINRADLSSFNWDKLIGR